MSRPCGFGAENDIVNQNIHSAALIRWQVGILWEAPFRLNRKSVVLVFEYLEKTISQFVVSSSSSHPHFGNIEA